jgi:hypothetical protein
MEMQSTEGVVVGVHGFTGETSWETRGRTMDSKEERDDV